jgi:hypothetical protein
MSPRAASTCSQTFHNSTPPYTAVAQIIDDALMVGLLPVGNGLQARIKLANGFVSQLKKV